MSADAADNANPPAEQQAQGRFGRLREKLRHQLAPELPTWQRSALAATLLVDALMAISLAVWDFMLATGPLGSLLAAILLAIGIANLWSLHSLIRKAPSWQTHAFVAQVLIALLALYVIETAAQNPQPRIWVKVIAAVFGIVAIGWAIRLATSARLQWTKTTTTIVSLIPLAGFVQFGLQSNFIPKITAPLIDVSTTLSPIGRTGQHIQMSATAVIHNRGTQRVYLAGGLMRVMAYPFHLGEQRAPTPDDVKRGLDLAGDTDNVFDSDPIPPAEGQLIYAANITAPGDDLDPGDTDTVQRVIEVGPDVRVRFTVVELFFASREIRDVKTCDDPQLSRDDPSFDERVEEELCMDYELQPRNIIEKIVGPSPVLRVFDYYNPLYDQVQEYPTIYWTMASDEQLRRHHRPTTSEWQKLMYANPAVMIEQSSEYAPTDKEWIVVKTGP